MPRNPSQLLAQLYSSGAREYAALWAPVIQPMGERLIAALETHNPRVVLDLGSGTGALAPAIRRAAPAAVVIGVDRAVGMLRVARTADPGARLAAMDLLELGLGEARADAAIMAFVLFLLPDPPRALGEARRILRRGGVLAVTTWGPGRELPGDAIWTAELDATGAAPDVKPAETQRERMMDSVAKLRALLDGSGLLPLRVWAERPERCWKAEELYRLGKSYGTMKRRLDSLPAAVRNACLARVRACLDRMTPEELSYRPEVIFAIAVKNAGG